MDCKLREEAEKIRQDIEIQNMAEKKFDDDIWIYDRKGNKIGLDIKNMSLCLLKKYNFLTCGNDKFTTYFFKDGIYIEGGEKQIATECEKMTDGKILKTHIVREVVDKIRRNTFIDRNLLHENDINLICLRNGIYNLKTKELIPHTPEIIFLQKIPVCFNEHAKCPKILKFFGEVLDGDDILAIQEFFGYCLYRKYNFKRGVILVGEKDTGKTTFLKLLINFIGQKNTSGVSLHYLSSNNFATSTMEYKLLNSYDDLSFRDLNDVSVFKMATGGGFLPCEKKFGELTQFMNYAKLIFATNKISGVKDIADSAYYERWLIFYFKNVFEQNDVQNEETEKANPNLIDEISAEEEMSGLLNWALVGLDRLQKNGKFSYRRTAEQNKNLMLKEHDSIFAFNQDLLTIKVGSWISKEDLYNIYLFYCKKNGLAPITKIKFGRDFPLKTDFKEGRKDCEEQKSVKGWLNVSFTENTDFTEFFKHIYVNYKQENVPLNNTLTTFPFTNMYKIKSVKSVNNETEFLKKEINKLVILPSKNTINDNKINRPNTVPSKPQISSSIDDKTIKTIENIKKQKETEQFISFFKKIAKIAGLNDSVAVSELKISYIEQEKTSGLYQFWNEWTENEIIKEFENKVEILKKDGILMEIPSGTLKMVVDA